MDKISIPGINNSKSIPGINNTKSMPDINNTNNTKSINTEAPAQRILILIVLILLIAFAGFGFFAWKRGVFDKNVTTILKNNEIQEQALSAVDKLYTIFDFDKTKVASAIKLKQKDIDDLKANSGGFLDSALENDFVISIKVSDNTFISLLYRLESNRILNIEWAVLQNGSTSSQTSGNPSN